MDASAVEVLIVDHAPTFRELLDIFLADEGYQVSDVSIDALPVEEVARRPAALYIVGLKPGESKDFELLERLRRQEPRSPVIVVSTNPQLLQAVRAQPERYAGDRFLRLPLDLNDLLQEVRALIPRA